jgi:hypothetical protein
MMIRTFQRLMMCGAVSTMSFGLSCRSEIAPIVRAETAKGPRLIDAECRVMDYRMGTDVPIGAQNLGWITVARLESDEKTFEKIREAICLKGGNAFSQARWVRAAGASVADAPIELEANAWLEPTP